MSKQQNNDYCFLFETTTIVPNSEIEILEEVRTEGGGKKISFKSRLQESNVRNQNKRVYNDTVCESIVEQLGPKAKSRSLLCEIDHPMGSGSDPVAMKRRAAIIEVKNCGAVIRDIQFKNGEIIGTLETLSSFRGPDLYKLIADDKIDIGWSLRALGGVRPLRDGTLEVRSPIRAITYDIVSNPSHANAKIMEFLPESDMSILSQTDTILAEDVELNLLNDQDQIIVCENGYCVRQFMDDVIRKQFTRIIGKGLRFNL